MKKTITIDFFVYIMYLFLCGIVGYCLYPVINSPFGGQVDPPSGYSTTERIDEKETTERIEWARQKTKAQEEILVTEPSQFESLSEAYFGIYLGETIDELQKRYTLTPVDKNFTYREYPVSSYQVLGTSDLLKECVITAFQDHVFSVVESFVDVSSENHTVVKQRLSLKYEDGGHWLKTDFFTKDKKVRIMLSDYNGHYLTVEYIHQSLASLAKEECLKLKGNDLGDAI